MYGISFNLLIKRCVMTARLCWIVCLFLLDAGLVWADGQSIRVIRSENVGTELQLEVRQAPLQQVLDKIAGDTGLPIHYSVLPEGMVTATCVGTTLKQVLECLLDRKADLIFRYPQASSQGVSQQIQPEEVWVLGTKFEQMPGSVNPGACKPIVTQQQAIPLTAGAQADTGHSEPDQTDALVARAKSKNPADRADAISSLMTAGKAGDAAVRKVLEESLSDQDANVRAQAISSLAHREGDGATAELQEALHDSDASVRLMVVDNMGENAALLQQALTDSDATVRELAAMRLESLSNTVSAE